MSSNYACISEIEYDLKEEMWIELALKTIS